MNETQEVINETGDHAEDSEQYLSFIVAGEEFAIDILRVQEIKSWDKVTSLPGSPNYVAGAINLRGTIVPVINLRKRFFLPDIKFDKTTVIIVLKVFGEEHDRTMGLIVDAVSDVHDLQHSEIRPAPEMKGKIDSQFVTGLATINDTMVIVLDIDTLMNSGELALVQEEN